MLKENVIKLLNEQINKELFSAYLYLDIANYYTNEGLDGFSNWFSVQAKEELSHAMKFMGYLQENNVQVVLEAISKPTVQYPDWRVPLVDSLKHEEYITKSIHQIYELALEEKDYRTIEFLNYFVKEQNEEEKNATELIQKYDIIGKAVYMLDRELKARQ